MKGISKFSWSVFQRHQLFVPCRISYTFKWKTKGNHLIALLPEANRKWLQTRDNAALPVQVSGFPKMLMRCSWSNASPEKKKEWVLSSSGPRSYRQLPLSSLFLPLSNAEGCAGVEGRIVLHQLRNREHKVSPNALALRCPRPVLQIHTCTQVDGEWREAVPAETIWLEQGAQLTFARNARQMYTGNHSCWFSHLLVSASALIVSCAPFLSSGHRWMWFNDYLGLEYPSSLPLRW